jgi:hypothetical protein
MLTKKTYYENIFSFDGEEKPHERQIMNLRRRKSKTTSSIPSYPSTGSAVLYLVFSFACVRLFLLRKRNE